MRGVDHIAQRTDRVQNKMEEDFPTTAMEKKKKQQTTTVQRLHKL